MDNPPPADSSAKGGRPSTFPDSHSGGDGEVWGTAELVSPATANGPEPPQRAPRPPVAPAAATSAQPRSQLRLLVDRRWAVLATLFLVTAALGLPLLWYSRAFGTIGKVVWTVVVLLYTALILWLFWLVMAWSWARISSSLG